MGRRHTVKKWYHLKLSILIWVWFLAEKVAVFALNSDKSALLELKNSILDPYNVLSSWKSSDSTSNFDHCSWYGVSCDSNHFVTALNITGGGSSCSRISGFPLFGFGIKRPCSNEKSSVQGKLSPAIAKLGELRILVLPFNELNGEIPNEIWGREKLEVLDLEGNSISGSLPVHFSGMKNLKVLNLGFNKISGNIPNSVFVSTSLRILNLAGNQLNGTIPRFGFWFRNLKGLYLSFNQLTGSIPREIGLSCEELEYLELSGNYLTGEIPRSLGNCTRLRSVLLYSNLLVGVIPSEFGFHSHLEVLDLSRNSLSGAIPPEIGNCSMLSVLVLSNTWDPLPTQKPGLSNDEYNFYTGTIPLEITRMSSLRMLWVPRASLDGKLPNWVNCDNLEIVNLAYNFYTGGISDAFSSCKNLHYLDLSSNKLTGRIPQNLPVPCMNLFDVSSNSLSGPIPRFSQNICSNVLPVFDDDAGNLPSSYLFHFAQRSQIEKSPIDLYNNDDGRRVVIHDFSSNHFTGPLRPLPIVVSKQRKTLHVLSVAKNNLSGPFPRVLFERCGEFSSLIVNISKNVFTGQIPANIGVSCSSLKLLDGSWNRIFGTIPSSIGNLVSIISLNLSRNFLEASLPSSIGKLKGLKFLSLSGNKLTGSIPDSISRLNSLQVLDMSSNLLTGEIPKGLVDLRNLTVLRLDSNKLSGQIPSGLSRLFAFNVSYNNLSGPLPSNGMKCSNVLGNPYLASCRMFSLRSTSENQQGFIDDPQSRDPAPPGGNLVQKVGNGGGLNSIEIASISSAAAIFSVLVALVALFIYTRKCGSRPRVSGGGSVRKEVTVFTDIGVPLNFENIVNATANFNASNCIGNGGFGATYKAEIAPGVIVAIKRLAVGRFQGFQQFDAEIKTLGRLRHKNLVTLVGYHTSEYEMFLIYNYLPGGNLEKFIQERSTRAVYWRVLHKIALDVARALTYLHDQCVPRVLHRDVKPSNILLDDDLNAYLSDFGLARLLGTSETHATTGVAGTFGYVAPEYAMTCRVSDKADVYSYGVVLLELISDKKALDPSFSPYGNGFNIVTWASMLLRQGRAKEFFTAGLWETGPHDDLVDVLHLAILCTVDSLSTRPTMKLVVRRLTQMQPPSC